jgi:exodeoxyribonuclease V gamma subunit
MSGGLQLEDTLTRLRANATGERVMIRLQASAPSKNGQPNWCVLVQTWPEHLAAQLGGPTTTHLIGPGSAVTLRPLEPARSEALLDSLMEGYLHGLTELLPLACKTCFAALRAADDESGAHPAQDYEGGYLHGGECEDHPGYQRFWPTYARLISDPRFKPLTQQLYRPLFDHQPEPSEI